jgi:hypothetical protein
MADNLSNAEMARNPPHPHVSRVVLTIPENDLRHGL